jgi:hypothetical protein
MVAVNLCRGRALNMRQLNCFTDNDIEVHVVVGHEEILPGEAIGGDLEGVQPQGEGLGEKVDCPSRVQRVEGKEERDRQRQRERELLPKCELLTEGIDWNNGVAVLKSILRERRR